MARQALVIWELLALALLASIVVLSLVPETWCSSYPIQKREWESSRRNEKSMEDLYSKSSKGKRKHLKVSKNVFSKLKGILDQEDSKVEEKVGPSSLEQHPNFQSVYKGNLADHVITVPEVLNSTKVDKPRKGYDCPGDNSVDPRDSAIIKSDPWDCSCYYGFA